MPEKQRRPQDKPLRGGVGAVYRRAILPCQMRNGLEFRFFVSSFASGRPAPNRALTAASIWHQGKRLQGRDRLTFEVARQSWETSLAVPEQAPSVASLAANGALDGSIWFNEAGG